METPKRAKPQKSLSLSPELWAAFDAICEENSRDRSQQVAAWIKEETKRQAKKKLKETP